MNLLKQFLQSGLYGRLTGDHHVVFEYSVDTLDAWQQHFRGFTLKSSITGLTSLFLKQIGTADSNNERLSATL